MRSVSSTRRPRLASLLVGIALVGAGPAAASGFWDHWGDGRAELSSYRIEQPRYGEPRDGVAVLIFVTEDHDSRSWVKHEGGPLPAEHRVPVMKLNHTLRFQTGIYPYSVMTSVFAPVDGGAPEPLAPVKLTLTAQEWCGHVFEALWPEGGRFRRVGHSYFGGEGDSEEVVVVTAPTLYEDALLIQLRELNGPFADGGDWSGWLVPTLWSGRIAHQPPRPERATIRRADTTVDGIAVTRFTIASGGVERTVDVEKAAPRRIVGWTDGSGLTARRIETVRLPYWRLHSGADTSYLEQLGLSGSTFGAPPASPSGTSSP